MSHLFQVEDAVAHGVDAAILLQHIRLWVATNAANGDHLEDGQYWARCTMTGLQKLYPYLSVNQVRRALERLRESGVVVTRQFGSNIGSRALWYGLAEHATHVAAVPNETATNPKEINKPINKRSRNKQESHLAYMPNGQNATGGDNVNELTKDALVVTNDHVANMPHGLVIRPEPKSTEPNAVLTKDAKEKENGHVANMPHASTLFELANKPQKPKFSKHRIKHLRKKRRCTYLLLYYTISSNSRYISNTNTIHTSVIKEKENTEHTTLHYVCSVKEKESPKQDLLIPLTIEEKSIQSKPAKTKKVGKSKAEFDIGKLRRDVAIHAEGPDAGLPVDPVAFIQTRNEIAKMIYNIIGRPESNFSKKKCLDQALAFIDYWNSHNWKRKGGDMISLAGSVRTWVNNNYNKGYDKTPSHQRVEGAIAGLSSVAADLSRIAELQVGAGDTPAF